MPTTRTSNGTDSDTQTQINASAAGDTVQIPNGTFTWATGISCSTPITIKAQTIGSVNIVDNKPTGILVSLTPPASGSLTLSGISFTCGSAVNDSSNGHIAVVNFSSFPVTTGPVLIHDCNFSTPGITQVLSSMLMVSQNGTVIWNCTFNTNAVMNPSTGQPSAGDECIQFKNPGTDVWKSVSTMGLSGDPNGTQNTYVEDCTFSNNFTEALDFDDGSRTAVRHCTFNLAAIASHGYDTSPWSTRHWELYNNNFISDNGTTNIPNGWATMRGGTGLFTNNTFGTISGSQWGAKDCISWLTDGACQAKAGHCYTTIPVPRAIGQGWSGGSGSYSYPQAPELGSGYIEDPSYVWANTTSGADGLWGWNTGHDCPSGFDSSHFIIQNTDFFIGTAKPGWSAFTYPHPIRGAVTFSPPTVPTGLTAAAASSSQINLSWATSTDTGAGQKGDANSALTYPMEHQGGAFPSFVQFGVAPGVASGNISASDTGLAQSTPYSYRIRSQDTSSDLSAYTGTVSATTQAASTVAPTVPNILSVANATSTSLVITWSESTDSSFLATQITYTLQSKTGAASFSTIATGIAGTGTGTISFTNTSLTAATSYTYQVQASNPNSQSSAYSTSASGSTLPQAPALVQSNSVSASSASTTQCSFSSAQAAGHTNVVVVSVSNPTALTIASLTDQAGHTYTLAAGPTTNGSLTQWMFTAPI